jgi:hypothetical protein
VNAAKICPKASSLLKPCRAPHLGTHGGRSTVVSLHRLCARGLTALPPYAFCCQETLWAPQRGGSFYEDTAAVLGLLKMA